MATPPSSPQHSPPPQVHPPPPTSSTASRRLPPPCWSPDETVALIDAYREKWYSLRRGNLRATHWQEVADSVTLRCPLSTPNPPKTAVQCRHKMEKLRKRYRAEIQRSNGHHRYSSSWVHFKRMDAMEKGPTTTAGQVHSGRIHCDDDEDEEENEDEEEELYSRKLRNGTRNPSVYGSMSNGIGSVRRGGNGFGIGIPGRASMAPPMGKMYGNQNPNPDSSHNSNYGYSKNLTDGEYMGSFGMGKSGSGGGGGKMREGDAMAEVVVAVKVLGDGFVRMEKMKMEMAREVEVMRMEMEMKRTEMILESQQRIVEAFAKAFLESKNKKAKRMPTPES